MTVHTALGELDRAMEWLERAVEERSGWLVYLQTEPRFDPLRAAGASEDILCRLRGV